MYRNNYDKEVERGQANGSLTKMREYTEGSNDLDELMPPKPTKLTQVDLEQYLLNTLGFNNETQLFRAEEVNEEGLKRVMRLSDIEVQKELQDRKEKIEEM